MSKLHFYRTVGGNTSKFADGDGDLNTGGFTAKITDGEVKQGTTYEVRKGQGAAGDNYPCTTGASKNGTASFGAKA